MANLYDPKVISQLKRSVQIAVKKAKNRATEVDYSSYADDPEGFIRDVLKDDKLWDKTLEMIESVRVNRKTTVKGANAVGKDHTAAELALWWMYAKGGLVIVTGPTQKQVFEIFFGRELRSLSARAGLAKVQRFVVRAIEDDIFEDDERDDIEGKEKCGILGVVSTDVSKMTGHHAPYVMCIVSEAQGVTGLAFSTIFNNATGEDDRFLVVGNPKAPEVDKTDFYDTFREDSGWNRITIPAAAHPNIVQKQRVIPGGPSLVWLEDVRKQHKETSAWWKTFVAAEFPERGAANVLLAPADVAAMRQLFLGEFRARANNQPYIIGIDLAKGGGDRGAMAIMRGPCLMEMYAFDTGGVIETEQRILAKLREIGARPMNRPASSDPFQTPSGEQIDCVLVIDQAPTGAGPSVIAHLRADHGYEAVSFNFSSRVRGGEETERYENLRAFGYWAIKLAAQERRLAICEDVELEEELLAITYTFANKDQVLITPKKEIMKMLKRSPDKADAFMMAWSQYNEQASVGGTAGVNLGF